MSATEVWSGDYLWRQFEAALLNPIRAFRLRYLPLLMVYFAYGATGLIAVAESFWVKKALTLTPVQLAALAVWTTLPWTVKMVFGELVDSVPLFGSQRTAYVLIGASFTATGMVTLAGAAGGWLAFLNPDGLYVLGAMMIVIGTVIQDVVADAMSTEVVARTDAEGHARPDGDVRAELGMVQVLGRIALSTGIKLAVISALGAPALAVLIFEALLNATSMFNHGNVRIPPGVDRSLRWLVVIPNMHRIHHSIVARETNSNFGFNLPWWDRLFGTYRADPAAGLEAMTVGIDRFRDPGELRLDRMLTQPFRDDKRLPSKATTA